MHKGSATSPSGVQLIMATQMLDTNAPTRDQKLKQTNKNTTEGLNFGTVATAGGIVIAMVLEVGYMIRKRSFPLTHKA